jgi:hypothetical protein
VRRRLYPYRCYATVANSTPPKHTQPQVLSNALVCQIAQLSGDQYVVLKTSTALVRFCALLDITSGLFLNRTYWHTPRYVRGHTTTNQHTPECTCPWERDERETRKRNTRPRHQEIQGIYT